MLTLSIIVIKYIEDPIKSDDLDGWSKLIVRDTCLPTANCKWMMHRESSRERTCISQAVSSTHRRKASRKQVFLQALMLVQVRRTRDTPLLIGD